MYVHPSLHLSFTTWFRLTTVCSILCLLVAGQQIYPLTSPSPGGFGWLLCVHPCSAPWLRVNRPTPSPLLHQVVQALRGLPPLQAGGQGVLVPALGSLDLALMGLDISAGDGTVNDTDS